MLSNMRIIADADSMYSDRVSLIVDIAVFFLRRKACKEIQKCILQLVYLKKFFKWSLKKRDIYISLILFVRIEIYCSLSTGY